MIRKLTSLLLVLMMAIVVGCASSGVDTSDTSAGITRPTLSVSMTRGVPQRDVEPSQQAALENTDDKQQKFSSETGVSFYRVQVGDPIVVSLRGIYPRDEQIEELVDEDGNITLPLLGDIQAAGKSTSQIESKITSMYIDGGYYRSITVNVVVPSRTYFIRGEVKSPGRYPVVSGITIMQAIAAAGGYTEFANQRNVRLSRGDSTTKVSMRKIENNPELDIRLESGDVIVVDRSLL